MCGIAGIVGFRDQDAATNTVKRMLIALRRRGPDSEGIYGWSKALFGHRRLSIFDLSDAGDQPMLSRDGNLGVVFNGAIYNFRELRKSLEEIGYSFRSQTDTEVLLHGYHAWGVDQLVEKLRGMFAFGLWDNRTRELYLVRDRLGVKPLCYTTTNGQLAFASTPRSLRAANLACEIDKQAIVEFLEFGYITDERSVYENTTKVRAGHILQWKDGKFSEREYWRQPAVEETSISFKEAVEETERLFLQAVQRRLFADVPVGALLSGGIDSGLVCWAIAELGGNITAYTVGTPGDVLDETSDAKATANQLGVRHEVLPLVSNDEPQIDDLTSAYAEPFACASALGMLGVARVVRASATVLLTGDGGDDIFLGYPEHKHLWLAQNLANATPQVVGNVLKACQGIIPRHGTLKRLSSFLSYSTGGIGAVASAHDGLPMYKRNRLLGDMFKEADVPGRKVEWSPARARTVLSDFLAYDRKTRFTGEYMTKVDGATMHHSLEARSPFLDQDLWEFAARLPFQLRLHGGRLKSVLREIARRRLGSRVSRGRKRGFGIPVQRWLVHGWRRTVEESLRGGMLEKLGMIQMGPVMQQLDKAAQEGCAPNQLWYLFVLEKWLRAENEIQNKSEITPERVAV
jgi:asparagine synthase (glutamine-hydrolysing)